MAKGKFSRVSGDWFCMHAIFQPPLTRRRFDWDEPVGRSQLTARFIDRYAIEAPPLEKGAI
jgi:hypothetical protein